MQLIEEDEDDFLTKYTLEAKIPIVKQHFQPVLEKIKGQILLQNLKQSDDSRTQEEMDDREYVGHGMLQLLGDYPNDSQDQPLDQPQIDYPHSKYADYNHVKREFQADDEYVRAFPILKKFNDQFNYQGRTEFFSMLVDLLSNKNTISQKQTWEWLTNKWGWNADLFEISLQQALLASCSYERVKQIQNAFPVLEPAVIQHTFQKYQQDSKIIEAMIRKGTTAIKFSVDANQRINQVSITRSCKQLFCRCCMIFDCGKHKLEDEIYSNIMFVHPKNKPSLSRKIDSVNELLSHYQQICSGEIPQQMVYRKKPCENNCYLNLNIQKFIQLRAKVSYFIPQTTQSLIKMSAQMCNYDPCSIVKIVQPQLPCCAVFWYFIKILDVKKLMETDFKDPQDYYNQYGVSDSIFQNSIKKKNKVSSKEKKSSSKKRGAATTKVSQVQQYMAHVTPICFHSFLNKQLNQQDKYCNHCTCQIRGFCLQSCLCPPKCPLRRKGCNCCLQKKGQTSKQSTKRKCSNKKQCPCLSNQRQCIPGICRGCFPKNQNNLNEYGKITECKNNQYQLKQYPKTKIGKSIILDGGLGLFAGQNIPKFSIILPYTGQLIDQNLEVLREKMCVDHLFYNFAFQSKSIDAKYFGNKSRFINHDNNKRENCYAMEKFAGSDLFLAIFALKDIEKNEELFFDYDGNGALLQFHKDKYPFITKRPKKLNTQ